MEIFPITDVYFSERDGEMIDTGVIIGYQAIRYDGIVIASGETIAEATEAALIAMYSPESGISILTNGKFGYRIAE
ncbi:MAG: hypothetical protein AAB660_01020 [Patescibacteria group bacterium]